MASVTRFDPEIGIVETVGFFGQGPLRIFGSTHAPEGRAVGGVVICSPVLAEFLRNYRNEVMLARDLAVNGFAVQRFHYRGSGHSDGEWCDATFETMRDDAIVAAEWLKAATGVSDIAFVGTRWGALIAASAIPRFPMAPLVVIEPPLDCSRYFREVLRWRLMRELKEGVRSAETTEELLRSVQAGTQIDVLGYPLSRSLVESSSSRTLEGELGTEPRSMLLIQVGRAGMLRHEYVAIRDTWRQAGFSVEWHVIATQHVWWFPGVEWNAPETRAETTSLVRLATNWTARQFMRYDGR